MPISLETATPTGSRTATGNRPKGGFVFIAALKQGSVFILGGIHSAFRVKCKRADVFSYYPPQEVQEIIHGEKIHFSRRASGRRGQVSHAPWPCARQGWNVAGVCARVVAARAQPYTTDAWCLHRVYEAYMCDRLANGRAERRYVVPS